MASRRRHTPPVPGDIAGALDELKLAHTTKGGNIFTLCPYHDDFRPGSFSIRSDTGENYCFSCDTGGPFARLVAAVLKCDPFTAGRWCRDRAFNTDVPFEHEELEYGSGKIDTSEQVNEASLALCTAPPQDALDSRQINADSAEAFGLLWDQGKWIIPVRDPHSGTLWGWQEKRDRFFRNYPKGLSKSLTLFGINSFLPGGLAVLVESPLDAVRLHSAGVPGGLSSYGVGVSDEQLDLVTYFASGLVLALDNDMAGMSKMVDICQTYHVLDAQVFNYGDSRAKDVGEMTNDEIRWGVDNALLWPEILEIIS